MKHLKFLLCTFTFVSFFAISEAYAKPQLDSRTDKVLVTQKINASATEVWDILARLDGVEQIVPHMIKSTKVVGEGQGAVRICTDHDGNEFHEEVLAFDNGSKRLAYTLSKGPMPLQNLVNSIQVLPLQDSSSLLVWSSKFDVPAQIQNPQGMVEMMNGMITMSAQGVKTLAEK